MIATVKDEKYGYISYDENFWSGKKLISIGGVILSKMKRNLYIYQTADQTIYVKVEGSYLFGVSLVINGERIMITEKPKWYEVALSVSIFIAVMIWGNVPALFYIFPVVSGAIGGAISGCAACVCLFVMRKQKNIIMKLITFLISFIAAILICFLFAVFLITVSA